MNQTLEFIPLYCREHLSIINPYGSVGVVTLWSKKEYIQKLLASMGVNMDKQTSEIAVIGNLYGNGLKFLLANLLYNPQIKKLLIFGWNRSNSLEELRNFFDFGVEEHRSLGTKRYRIIGTNRTIDTCLSPELFNAPPEIVYVGDVHDEDVEHRIREFFKSLHDNKEGVERERIEVKLPKVSVKYFPSNPRGHCIIKKSPLEAWKELIFRLHRFGHTVTLGGGKGERIELQNVKVVVEEPYREPEESLKRYGFSPELFTSYMRDILRGVIREDEAYNYGHRLRSYFGFDGLLECIKRLKYNRSDRRAFVSIWDQRSDLIRKSSAPCMVSLFFRLFDEKLTLSANFRVHNAVTAWLQNVYGLMSIQEFVSKEIGVPIGAITTISHSISINMLEYEKAIGVVKEKEKVFEFEPDPNGQFRISVEDGEIVVRHIFDGEVIGTYRSKKAERIQYELKRDYAISDIGHAIYIGRELSRAEECIKKGEVFRELS